MNSEHILTSSQFLSELEKIRTSSGVQQETRWSAVCVKGPDRQNFLQGMLTNDVKKLQPGDGNYNLILTIKGKILAELWVFNRGDDYLLITPNDCKNNVLETLEKYHIMEDLAIEDQSDLYSIITILGEKADKTIKQILPSSDSISFEKRYTKIECGDFPCEVIHANIFSALQEFVIVISKELEEPFLEKVQKAGAVPLSEKALEVFRIEAKIPAYGKELDDTILPQEATLEDKAISFSKGCFVGQEPVARLQYRGHVNRKLTLFSIESEEIPQDEIILEYENKKVGYITSCCYSTAYKQVMGMGYLRCEHIEKKTTFQTLYNEKPITIRPIVD